MTKRFKTRAVMVGSVGVGGDNPVRIQSMTTSNTRDVEATVEQAIRLVDAGCEIVRVTVQGIKEAEACEHIKNGLVKRGFNVPLVADIHFYPPAALHVADFVDKVRINPGNFVDKRASFKTIEYTDVEYAEELERIEEKFAPLIEKCKRLKRALRIGTNHGSLSDRIMNRYGDTPFGMVESALEFARICRKYDFHDIIFSMKSSNPQVMILAYRLLVSKMIELGWNYPLHLGVTEAGQAEDGRVKSAMGIGTLLLDGLGDTIRVSLTEDPWYEIDPCRRLVRFASSYQGKGIADFVERGRDFTKITKRDVHFPRGTALHKNGSVLLNVSEKEAAFTDFAEQIGCNGLTLKPDSADALVVLPSTAALLKRFEEIGVGLLTSVKTLKEAVMQQPAQRFAVQKDPFEAIVRIRDEQPHEWEVLTKLQPGLVLFAPTDDRLHRTRQFFDWLKEKQLKVPVILNFAYTAPWEDVVIQAAAECGASLCDGMGDGVLLEGDYPLDQIRKLSFNILQAARMRFSKTDFISCPSCGRTLFDLQDVTARIRARTAHLPGVKIAIMGCIVNGPGEMADADFGYVGSRPGMIDLYVGKECVEKNIPFADADDRLIELIKKHEKWIEPKPLEEAPV